MIDPAITRTFQKEAKEDALATCITLRLDETEEKPKLTKSIRKLKGTGSKHIFHGPHFANLTQGSPHIYPPKARPPQLELKQLPTHLHYAFLGGSSTYPIIISTLLSAAKEDKLLRVLREHRMNIAWTIY